MVKIDFRGQQPVKFQPQTLEAVVDLSKLQVTIFEPDKTNFDSFQAVKNMIHKGGNAEVRRGTTTLATPTSAALGIDMYESNKYRFQRFRWR